MVHLDVCNTRSNVYDAKLTYRAIVGCHLRSEIYGSYSTESKANLQFTNLQYRKIEINLQAQKLLINLWQFVGQVP